MLRRTVVDGWIEVDRTRGLYGRRGADIEDAEELSPDSARQFPRDSAILAVLLVETSFSLMVTDKDT